MKLYHRTSEAAAEATAARERLPRYDWRLLTISERLQILEVMDGCEDAGEFAARLVQRPDLTGALDRVWAASEDDGGPDGAGATAGEA